MKLLRSIILLSLLLSYCQVNSQSKKYQEAIRKYFISLPYDNKKLDDWLTEIKNIKLLQLDTFLISDTVRQIILKGRLLKPNALYDQADSVLIEIGQKVHDYKTFVNGRKMVDQSEYLPYLQQIFYFPKETITKQEWEILYKSTINDLDETMQVTYPKISFDKFAQPLTVVEFFRTGRPDAVITMRYGESIKSASYVIILTLNFTGVNTMIRH